MHAGSRGWLEDTRRADGGKKPLGAGHRSAGSPCQCHWRLMSSAVKRSIGSTTGFHNHGEGPY